MIGHRDGARLTVCDGCYRPKRTGEDGWARVRAEAPYRTPDEVTTGAPSTATLPVDRDYCPECKPAGDEQ